MRRVTPPPPPAIRPRLLSWLIAGVAIALVLLMDRRAGLDRTALSGELAAHRADAALRRLAAAPEASLPEPLRGLAWWPDAQRAPRLARLAALAPDEWMEAPDQPTVASPLGELREGPVEVRLREPADRPLRVLVRHVDLDLDVAEVSLPAGTASAPLPASWLPGARYAVIVRDPSDDRMVALASFRLLDDAGARAAAAAMAAAHDLGVVSHEASSLLAAIAALDVGLSLESIGRLAPLESAPGWEAVAHELHVLALDDLGLDWSARRLMDAGPETRR